MGFSYSYSAVEVGLQYQAYTVMETRGHVEVCVIVANPAITCPVAYNFSVLLVIIAGSAGMYHMLLIG